MLLGQHNNINIKSNNTMIANKIDNTLTGLSPIHHKIMRLYISGMKQSEIAEQIQQTPASVCRVINAPIFQHEYQKQLKRLNENQNQKVVRNETEALDQLRLQTRAAVKRITQGMKSDNENVAIKCAESILDRTGLGKVTKNETTLNSNMPVLNINVETVALIKQTLELDKDV